jgi:hypothetical protein
MSLLTREEVIRRTAKRRLARIEVTDDGHWPWPSQWSWAVPHVIGGRKKSVRASRMMWEAFVGALPPDVRRIRRTCDLVGCVRPEHHEPVKRRGSR